MKSNFAKLSDKTFFAIVIWLTSTIFFGDYVDGIYRLVVATAVTLIFLRLIKMKKQPDDYSALKEFAFLSTAETHKLIADKLGTRYRVEIFDDSISVNGTTVVAKFRDEKVCLSEVVEIAAKSKAAGRKKVIFLCPHGYTAGANEAATRSDIKVSFWGEKQTFEFLLAFDALIKKNKDKVDTKHKLSTLAKNALGKDKIKGYLITACLMLVMSRLYGAIYYIVIAAVCITLATACAVRSHV